MGSSATDPDATSLHAPRHPVPQLQGPFEESMAESINETVDNTKPDPVARRTMLIEGPTYERVCAGRWKQRPGEKFHPLWKISAQMSFGIHLLAEGLAKSEDDVMNILQTHVDDVDGFLESTTEDFDLAQSDVAERLRYLKLPLEHVEVFDRMLEDRAFRASIVEGNEKIEHILERTSEATKDALKDIQKGLQATDALGKYLERVNLSWKDRNEEQDAVFVAMVGNVDGWHRAFEDLYRQGHRLGKSLIELAAIVSEMQRRAGIASRKTLLRHEHGDAATQSPEPAFRPLHDGDNYVANKSRNDRQSAQVPSKPLPKAPGLSISSAQTIRRTSFQNGLSRQTISTTAGDKSTLYRGHGDGQASHKAVSGSRTTGPMNQKSASDVNSKPEGAYRANANGSPNLASLGLGSGLGLGRIMETNASRPVIVQRHTTPDGTERSAKLLDSKSKMPREHSARILTVSLRDQVPPLKKRLSLSPRSKMKDKQAAIHSKSASPRHSGQPRDSALPPPVGPGLGSEGPAVNTGSHAPTTSHESPHNSYFSKSLSSSPGVGTPSSEQSPPTPTVTASPPRKYSGNNPTFTSHPPNMEMATSPPLKQGQTSELLVGPLEVPGPKAVPDLDSGNTSYESSLGEPGPEISATDDGDSATQGAPIAELDSGTPVPQVLVELEANVPHSSQPVAFELEAPPHSRPTGPNTGARISLLTPTVGATIQSHSDFFKLPPQQVGDRPGKPPGLEREPNQLSQTFVAKDNSRTALLHRSFQLPAADQSKVSALPPREPGESHDAVRHRSFQLPAEGQPTGNTLTSAGAAQYQKLTPISGLESPADTGPQMSSLHSVTDDLGKVTQLGSSQRPPEGRVDDTTPNAAAEEKIQSTIRDNSIQSPPSDSSHADPDEMNEEARGDKSELTRDDIRKLPPRLSISEATAKSKRSSPKYHLNLIDIISHTPPGSPIHERPPSTASFHSAANSARVSSYRASIDLAPPEEAPAPPAPGGRGMVSPDYAAAGAFEGEKRPKRTSGASMNGLKKMLSRGSSNHSTTSSVRALEVADGRMSGGAVHDNVDLMTPGGSDVLWFKGMGRDGVWVSGS